MLVLNHLSMAFWLELAMGSNFKFQFDQKQLWQYRSIEDIHFLQLVAECHAFDESTYSGETTVVAHNRLR